MFLIPFLNLLSHTDHICSRDSFIIDLLDIHSLALDLSGLWMFEILGFADVQEKVFE